MNWKVYWQTRYTKVWKFCGGFETFALANEHIDYLTGQLLAGKGRKFKITGMLKSFHVCDLESNTP